MLAKYIIKHPGLKELILVDNKIGKTKQFKLARFYQIEFLNIEKYLKKKYHVAIDIA